MNAISGVAQRGGVGVTGWGAASAPGLSDGNTRPMDINQLRGWADLWDKLLIISIVVTAVAVIATGATAWLSMKYNGALRGQENSAFERYKVETDDRARTLDQEVARARERTAELERATVEADGRTALEKKHWRYGKDGRGCKCPCRKQALLALEQSKAPPANPARQHAQPRQDTQVVTSIARYAGASRHLYCRQKRPMPRTSGSTINAILTEAG